MFKYQSFIIMDDVEKFYFFTTRMVYFDLDYALIEQASYRLFINVTNVPIYHITGRLNDFTLSAS